PLPYDEATLQHCVERVRTVSDFLGQPLIIENPSSYVEFAQTTMSEWEFIARLADEADCGLLLDVNNIYVSAFNHGFDAREYIAAMPADRIVQIHLSGHTNYGTHIIDTHTGHVIDEVWALYADACSRFGNVSTMVEWDADIPEFSVVFAEALKAAEYREDVVEVACE